ncbi:ABC transporter ATP-binding protein [Polynucleobacter paneuropaeus]|nr:ABC transporter ATP-binding protein [Polynucleobacter paneuropaeus]
MVNTFALLIRLFGALSARRRVQIYFLTALIVVCALSEVVSIGSLLPFLSVLTEPQLVYNNSLVKPIIAFLGIKSPLQLLLPFTIFFCIATACSGALRLLLLFVSSRLTYAVGGDLSVSIYEKTLYQPYSVHIARNSSQVVDGVTNKTISLIECVRCSITIMSSAILLLIIIFTLFTFQPEITAEAFIGFGIIYITIIKITKRRLSENGALISKYSRSSLQSLQESLGGIRDILLDRTQQFYIGIYKNMVLPWRKAQGTNQFISGSPKFAIEALGVMLFAFIAYELSKNSSGIAGAIPVLGVLALSAQRMLPILQQMFSAWSDLLSQKSSLMEALDLLNGDCAMAHSQKYNQEKITFSDSLVLHNLSFSYAENSSLILNDINLQIKKGSRIGIIGTTGSGKSTLLDVLMGLLKPTHGSIVVDGVSISKENIGQWQDKISHVPQSIYLSDATISENIAFGIKVDCIDMERVKWAAEGAQIANAINEMHYKYQTMVGERGVSLSGGQRQRLGIARALYKGAEVIILDEATSALDSATEDGVMRGIENLSSNLTLIIVAHRFTTLKSCNEIYRLERGKIVQRLSPEELIHLDKNKPC